MTDIPTTDPHRQRSFREVIGGYFNHEHVPARAATRDADRVAIIITRDEHGDWLVSFTNEHGTTSGNFGPRADRMLTALADFLYESGAGNWSAVENEEPK